MREITRLLVVAVAVAVLLPFLTVFALSFGRIGFFAVGSLFVFALLLVVFSDVDVGNGGDPDDEP